MIAYSEAEVSVIETLKKKPQTTVAQLIAKGASRSTVRTALIKAQANGNLLTTPEWPRRYSWVEHVVEDEPDHIGGTVIEPDHVKPAEFGKRFNAGRPKIIAALSNIDPAKQDHDEVMKSLEIVGRAVLGLYVALSRVEEGPEWRKEAGIS